MSDAADGGIEIYRYDLGLYVTHPTLPADAITKAVDIEPDNVRSVGEDRYSAFGHQRRPGVYPDTRWNSSDEIDGERAFLSRGVMLFLDRLEKKREQILNLVETGGEIRMMINLPGRINIGDLLCWQGLKRLADLRVGLSIEVFPDMELPDGLGGGPKPEEEVWIPATGQFWTQDETGRWVRRGSATAFIRDCLKAGIPLPPEVQD